MPPGAGTGQVEGMPPTICARSACTPSCAGPPSLPSQRTARTARTRLASATRRTTSARRRLWTGRDAPAYPLSTGCSSGAPSGRSRGRRRCRPWIWARARRVPAHTGGARDRPAISAGRTSSSAAAATPCACGAQSARGSRRSGDCCLACEDPYSVGIGFNRRVVASSAYDKGRSPRCVRVCRPSTIALCCAP